MSYQKNFETHAAIMRMLSSGKPVKNRRLMMITPAYDQRIQQIRRIIEPIGYKIESNQGADKRWQFTLIHVKKARKSK